MPHETLIRKTSDITSEIIIVTRNYSSPLITIKIKQDGGKQDGGKKDGVNRNGS